MHSKTLFTFALCGTLLSSAFAADEKSLSALAEEQYAFAAEQYAGMLARVADDKARIPRSFADGKVRLVGPKDWVSGFFPGALWLVFEHTGSEKMKQAAEDFTARVESIRSFTGHHDIGFMLYCSYGQGYRLTKNPAYLAVLKEGAQNLATRFKPEVGLIRSWDFGPWKYPVIIDNMMNLELLVFAADNGAGEALRDVAFKHADKTLANHFRPDGSSFHLVDYDPADGSVLKKQTVQGYADTSSWARGQAWGLYGYTKMAALTKKPAYLEQARKIANYLRSHPNLPADAVPYWDFNAPDIPNAKRDSSAAAIMCSALFELATLTNGDESKAFRALAEKQLRSLSSPAYRAKLNENGNFLLMHAVGHMPEKSEIDVPLVYGDYYFLEALAYVHRPAR
jgi:unsaturated chondroitin disaccharide hydrolase